MRPRPWDCTGVRQFAAVPASAGAARWHAVGLVRGWGLAGVAEPTELLVSELATNALRASSRASGHTVHMEQSRHGTRTPSGRERIVMRLTCTDTHLVIEVWDGAAALPVRKAEDLSAEGGRGLFLVEALSRDWGYYLPWAGGKVVWCVLPLTESPFSAADDQVGPAHPLPHRDPGVFPEAGMPVTTTGDPQLLRRVVDGLRALGGWYLPAGGQRPPPR